jgi:hypothetical protein
MKRAIFLSATLTMLAACGDEEPVEDVDVEGCEHLQEGPEVAVTATDGLDESTPAVSDEHMRYDITLVPVVGGNGGFVTFAAAEATDHVFFLDADVALGLDDGTGAGVTIEESASSSPECDEIRGRHVAELRVGTVYVELGPTTETEVSLVIEAMHDHDEE